MQVSSLVATVDLRTFQAWNSALVNLAPEATLEVEGRNSLPPWFRIPQRVGISGLELLLEVGSACARPTSLDDPARLFALLRYATALSGAGELSLKQDLATLDRHKKGVLSDELGCGMACLLGHRYGGVEYFLDVDDALRQQWIRTSAPRSKRPDYIGLIPGSQGLVVLEAKGSQGSAAYCRTQQVRAGCRQVSAVHAPPPYQIEARVVVATLLQREDQRHDSKIFVGDPEEERAYPYVLGDDLLALCRASHYGRVALLIGAEGLARDLLKNHTVTATPQELDRSRPAVTKEVAGELHVGSELRFECGDLVASLFLGLSTRTWEALLEGRWSDARRGAMAATPAQPSLREPGRAAFFADDGSVICTDTVPGLPPALD